jgi:hypothetical protein
VRAGFSELDPDFDVLFIVTANAHDLWRELHLMMVSLTENV